MFDLNRFISKNVTMRDKSMFEEDMLNNSEEIKSKISGKKVLVIGGAGSIGSSFITEILKYKPESLVVVDINENGLAELSRNLLSEKDVNIPNEFITYPMDYASSVFKKMFISRKGFDIVANFSAHKHVRSEKDIFSIEAMLRNNILNARILLDLLSEYPPEEFFCVSTDKAANPVNIMGASKRIMEDLIFSYSDNFEVKTARFANVAFSNGSLPDGFIKRINNLQPLSAPYDVKRYFVSPEESGQICLLSCVLGKNREIFFPKLEKSQMMSFDQIAIKLLGEYGYNVLKCSSEQEAKEKAAALRSGSREYPVYFSISDTSGEKTCEEFFVEGENVDSDRFISLSVIDNKSIVDKRKIDKLMDDLDECLEQCSAKDRVVNILRDYLPNFNHIETGKSLDEKM